MPLFDGVVLAQREIAREYFELDFSWPAHVAAPLPGEFVTVRVSEAPVPLLRRPFGVSAFSRAPTGNGTATMIYWRRGPATRLLAGFSKGDELQVMGPLGRGFPSPKPGHRPVLVAGGVGIGPILFLANELARSTDYKTPDPLMLVGARSESGLPRVETHKRVMIRVCTDDGSSGHHGTTVDMLEEALKDESVPQEIYLCGPHGMLRAGHEVALRNDVTAWVSMEQTMGCAVGACMGCVVRMNSSPGAPDRYDRVCTEGPVFASTEIAWS